jgi:exoribonuclease R
MNLKNGEQDKSFTPYITRSVIRTCAKWNYQLVQNILDGEITSEDHLSADMKPVGHTFNAMRDDCFKMNEIAQKRRKRRLEGGSIMLYNREFFFQLD